jgi:hypothetical protein
MVAAWSSSGGARDRRRRCLWMGTTSDDARGAAARPRRDRSVRDRSRGGLRRHQQRSAAVRDGTARSATGPFGQRRERRRSAVDVRGGVGVGYTVTEGERPSGLRRRCAREVFGGTPAARDAEHREATCVPPERGCFTIAGVRPCAASLRRRSRHPAALGVGKHHPRGREREERRPGVRTAARPLPLLLCFRFETAPARPEGEGTVPTDGVRRKGHVIHSALNARGKAVSAPPRWGAGPSAWPLGWATGWPPGRPVVRRGGPAGGTSTWSAGGPAFRRARGRRRGGAGPAARRRRTRRWGACARRRSPRRARRRPQPRPWGTPPAAAGSSASGR